MVLIPHCREKKSRQSQVSSFSSNKWVRGEGKPSTYILLTIYPQQCLWTLPWYNRGWYLVSVLDMRRKEMLWYCPLSNPHWFYVGPADIDIEMIDNFPCHVVTFISPVDNPDHLHHFRIARDQQSRDNP